MMRKALTVFLCLQLTNVFAIDKIVIKGSKFFNSKTGAQFYFNGVDYQPLTGNTNTIRDPLVDEVGCKRDVTVFKDLGINAIRVYETDYTQNHDVCMKALSDAGIYVMLDISIPKVSIDRSNPSWDTTLYSYYTSKVAAFSKYDNVIAYIIGNEVSNDADTTPASAFVKAALRDVKSYMKSNKIDIPVGYVDNDDPAIRDSLISYFNCGTDANSRADFYGVNTYRWCGADATYTSSGYDDMVAPFRNYSIPVIITEYGCNTASRSFDELKSILGSDLEGLLSGALLYEYSQESSNYGIVTVSYGNTNVQKLTDYDTFKAAIASVSPKGTTQSNYNPSNSASTCPSISANWEASSTLPPTPSQKACDCLQNSFKCTLDPSFDITSTSDSDAAVKAVNIICGLTSCSDISANATSGVYGPYSFCNATEKFSWVFNKSYLNRNGESGACRVDNVKTVENKSPSVSDPKTCDKLTSDTSSSNSGSNSGSDSGSNNSSKSGATKISFNASGLYLLSLISLATLFSYF